ncbi:hypothetical protein UFOVP1492_46 [uncultured Caudovirales phage]|uniref:Uncharacterized protein n=1 Tax=uncultured Caudovirales phage TaxID=2100421 RepID=A0A6J5QSJ8_9CAUD|nr:hypothetical protein UFOVP1127_88 [uncultured Caudovirales phage]CAB4193653.1 hypothetical protein UFOVP1242_122 [uncultured Caudovirales phage]CAB4217581.1 hypothetical protein UFOVP1492_46 [uncultured Caudovirales phage]CAB5231407.1 hypothetical protein UFOVP1580_75 [uncultured Caudovirales phage]
MQTAILIIEENPIQNAITKFVAFLEEGKRVFLDFRAEHGNRVPGECWKVDIEERNGNLRASPIEKVYEYEYREEDGDYVERIFCGRLLISEVRNLKFTRYYITDKQDILNALRCHAVRSRKSAMPIESFKFCLIWCDEITYPLTVSVRRNTMLGVEALIAAGHITRQEAGKAAKK